MSKVCLIATLLLLAACSTPQPARDLAAQGAAMTDKAQSETLAFVQRADQAYRRREAILRDLAEGEIRDTAAGDFRAWIDAEVGVSTNQARIDTIKKIADQSRLSRESLQAALDAKRAEIAAPAASAVEVPTKNLDQAKKAFLNLAQELTAAEWLKYSWSYVQQVHDDLKALKAPAGAASAPAVPASGASS